ncbi:MAG TPA: hypothetical protein VGO03_09260 [Acidimicrobiia bacterium]
MSAGHEAEASTHAPVRQELALPPGARVVVFSDIHIPPEADSRSTIVAAPEPAGAAGPTRAP